MNKSNIKLFIEYGRVWKTDELTDFSIALDGAVSGPYFDNIKHIYSFDHHANCIRHITNATCVQVLDSIILGLNSDNFNIYINDLDADTIISFILLLYPELVKDSSVQELVRSVGLIDAHGPAYQLSKSMSNKTFFVNEKIIEPSHKLRNKREYSSEKLEKTLFECVDKFLDWYKKGMPSPNHFDRKIRYKIQPETNKDWIMVNSEDFAFRELYSKGYSKIILWQENTNGTYSYTIGKKSEFVNFPVSEIINHLNTIENGWGGGSTIGGSPRNPNGERSRLKPEEIKNIILNFLEKEFYLS